MKKLYIIAILALGLTACRKENVTPIVINPLPPVNPADTISVLIDQEHPGFTISPTFEGLSFETAILTETPQYMDAHNSVFIQLIKNLGPGILRIGAGSSDKIGWSGIARDETSPDSTLTTSDIDRLAAFSKLTGWPVLFGLNLGQYQSALCANEAAYVYNSLGTNLYAFQLGNEPNYFTNNRFRPAPILLLII